MYCAYRTSNFSNGNVYEYAVKKNTDRITVYGNPVRTTVSGQPVSGKPVIRSIPLILYPSTCVDHRGWQTELAGFHQPQTEKMPEKCRF